MGGRDGELVWVHIFHFCAFIAVGDDVKICGSERKHRIAKLLLANYL